MMWHMHREAVGDGSGKKHRVDVLNRSAVVFIAACWESYIEDLASEAFDFLLENAKESDSIPMRVRIYASRELRTDKDERKIWNLAGDGWRIVLMNYRAKLKARWLQNFNTPKSGQVTQLFSELLDIPDITASWTWRDMEPAEAATILDEFMIIRGNIAHRTKHSEQVHKSTSKNFLNHVVNIVEHSDDHVAKHITTLTGKSPW